MASIVADRCAPGASDDYIQARRALLQEELALRNHIEKVAAQRRALPQGPIMKEYTFTEALRGTDNDSNNKTKQTSLADLTANGRSTVVYGLMYGADQEEACPMCSSMVDALNAVTKHVDQHANFVIVAKAPIDKLRGWAQRRGWNQLRLLSSYDNDFNRDMHTQDKVRKEGMSGQQSGMMVFKKDAEGNVRHLYSAGPGYSEEVNERGLDLFSPFWSVLDIIPEGRGNFHARNDYVFAS